MGLNISEPAASTVAAKAGNTVTYTAASIATLGGLTMNELVAVAGLVIAIVSMIITHAMNWWFKWQHLKLARERAASEGDDE